MRETYSLYICHENPLRRLSARTIPILSSLMLHAGIVLLAVTAGSMGEVPLALKNPVAYEVSLVTMADAGGTGSAAADEGPVQRVESALPRRAPAPVSAPPKPMPTRTHEEKPTPLKRSPAAPTTAPVAEQTKPVRIAAAADTQKTGKPPTAQTESPKEASPHKEEAEGKAAAGHGETASGTDGTEASAQRTQQAQADKSHPLGMPKGEGEGLGRGKGAGIGHVDTLPRILRKVEPRYPVGAREGGISGSVQVRFVVDARGKVRDPEVMRAEPPDIFDKSALAAVRKWRFKPARKDGRSVATRVVLPIRFSLN